MTIAEVRSRLFGKKPAKRPADVFTPRAADVNPDMYVERPALEAALRAGLESSFHLLLRGTSARGKSWLYKKVLKDAGIFYLSGNLAIASRSNSITALLSFLVKRPAKKTFSKSKTGSLEIAAASGGIETGVSYELGEDPFKLVLEECRRRAGRAPAVLVLDNLEAIIDKPDLLREVADLIILLDDESYAKYKVKVLFIGAIGKLAEYYPGAPFLGAISNRVRDLPEVGEFTVEECQALIERGLIQELGLKISTEQREKIVSHIAAATQGVPQSVHEYCLELAKLAIERSETINPSMMSRADQLWAEHSTRAPAYDPDVFDVLGVDETDGMDETEPEPSVDERMPAALEAPEAVGTPFVWRDSPIFGYVWKTALWLLLAGITAYVGLYIYFLKIF